MKEQERAKYLTCERYFIFELLIFAAGAMGAYTYNLRGGIFCNAQTANVVLMGIALGKGEWVRGLYYLIPISAYILGSMLSEWLPLRVRRIHFLRWDTYLIGFEMLVLFGIGFLPLSAPAQIVQILITFICSMQYNTFRQAEGIPMATTFLTNHVRQIGVGFSKFLSKKDKAAGKRAFKHARMVLAFFAGAAILTLLCPLLQEKAIWLSLLPLGVSFLIMLLADRGIERSALEQKPSGH